MRIIRLYLYNENSHRITVTAAEGDLWDHIMDSGYVYVTSHTIITTRCNVMLLDWDEIVHICSLEAIAYICI